MLQLRWLCGVVFITPGLGFACASTSDEPNGTMEASNTSANPESSDSIDSNPSPPSSVDAGPAGRGENSPKPVAAGGEGGAPVPFEPSGGQGGAAGAGGAMPPEPEAGIGGVSSVDDGGGVADGGSSAGSDGGGDPGFTIRFDYRFDTTGMFDDPMRRELLEFAARQWTQHIEDEFDDIPAGTEVLVRNPSDLESESVLFVMEESIDDIVVFVGADAIDGAAGAATPSAAIGSVSNSDLWEPLELRYTGANFEPWTARVSFDTSEEFFFDETPETSDDISLDGPDFVSTAVHELGHVLGFGTAKAYDALVQDQAFTGTNAANVYGDVVPLAVDGNHFPDGLMIEGMMPIMDLSEERGFRILPTRLDLAVLADIGYEIRDLEPLSLPAQFTELFGVGADETRGASAGLLRPWD